MHQRSPCDLDRLGAVGTSMGVQGLLWHHFVKRQRDSEAERQRYREIETDTSSVPTSSALSTTSVCC